MRARRPSRRRIVSAAGLFLLAPFVGEFLLGNQPITALPWLLALAPMYGGGALLIREAARRLGGGWPMIITLAAAYALTEEGPIDQMIFNPGYLGLPDFDGFAPIPGLGISATLVQGALTLHTVWSISVPVAIMEAFAEDQQRPWLGRAGLIVVAVIFVLGSLVLAFLQWDRFHFIAEPLPLAVTGVVIMIMIVVAVRCARRPRRTPTPTGRERTPPRPRTVGLTAFALSGLYWIADLTDVGSINPWVELGCWIAYAVGCAVLLTRVARRPGWDRQHRLAAAGGLLCTYVWAGIGHAATLGTPLLVVAAGGAVCGTAAIVIIVLAARASARYAPGRGHPTVPAHR